MTQELHVAFAAVSADGVPFRRAGAPSWLAPRPSSQPRSAWITGGPMPAGEDGCLEEGGAIGVAIDLESAPPALDAPSERPLPAAPMLPAEAAAPRPAEPQAGLDALRALGGRLASEIASARRAALEASERDLVRLAVAIASRIVEREVTSDPATLSRWIHSGIDALTRDDDVCIVASPQAATMLAHVDGAPRVEIDSSFGADRFEVRTRFGSVDVGVRARLDTLVAELLGEAT
ncbi:MAG: FliH/SctL family protein [Polyangiaceae bacterium]